MQAFFLSQLPDRSVRKGEFVEIRLTVPIGGENDRFAVTSERAIQEIQMVIDTRIGCQLMNRGPGLIVNPLTVL